MRPTIKDIAKETGLSITTVSLVLNGKGRRISDKNKQLVMDTAQKLNYRPNQLAVGLLKKKTNTVGLIIPDISNVFFSELAKGVEDEGRKKGYNVILCNTNDQQDLEMEYIDMLADRGIDGMIISMSADSYGAKGEESLNAIRDTGMPAVVMDCFHDISDFSTVAVDNILGSYLATKYLIELGHQEIACITGPLGPRTNSDRLKGYKAALAEHGILFNSSLIYEGDFRYQSGYNAVTPLLEHNPTAIFCLNDMMAYGASKALKDLGLRIPDHISLVGFDDIFFSQMMDVSLTTVVQPIYQIGTKAASLLLAEIDNPAIPKQHVLFEPKLQVRSSTQSL